MHAKAAGARGTFEVLEDVSDLTDAKFLSEVGKKTPILTRVSTVGGEKGSSDTVRDIRGWLTKFFTEDGNHDFVFNDLPVFFVRDPVKFPSMNRSHKRHPRMNVPENNMFWDYHVNNPEGIHASMHLIGPRGIPALLAHINAFGVHTYTLNKEACIAYFTGCICIDCRNQDGSFVYVKWHLRPEAGIETMDSQTAETLAGSEPDYHVKDLFNRIEKGDLPTWLLSVQVMKPEKVQHAPIDIFDCTFTWPHDKYQLRTIGRLTLNENVRTNDCSRDRGQVLTMRTDPQLLPRYLTSRLLPIKHGARHRSFRRHGYEPPPPSYASANRVTSPASPHVQLPGLSTISPWS